LLIKFSHVFSTMTVVGSFKKHIFQIYFNELEKPSLSNPIVICTANSSLIPFSHIYTLILGQYLTLIL
jgi:hypothetical protein